MTQYIPKAAVMAEIERWIELLTNEKNQEGVCKIDKLSLGGRIAELQEIKAFINTLEVKEVDLDFEQELYKAFGQVKDFTLGMCIAKHFFELGFSVSNKVQKGEQYDK